MCDRQNLDDRTVPKAVPEGSISIAPLEYRGWPGSCLISNGRVDAIVVPSIGRVMQFRLTGETDGVFWVNSLLEGKLADPASGEWANFGGDKSWPAPQGDWEKVTGRAWPPPGSFDAEPAEAVAGRDEITLISKVDPNYGIQIVRRIRLSPALPVMTITTGYHKLIGEPIMVAVWVVTQLPDPRGVFALLPSASHLAGAFQQLAGPAPKELKIDGRLLSLARDPRDFSKIATGGSSLVWMDSDYVLRIDASHAAGDYPNDDSRTEVYTNPDPLPYVELETVGPLTTLSAGDRIESTNTYALTHRTAQDEAAEARKSFAL